MQTRSIWRVMSSRVAPAPAGSARGRLESVVVRKAGLLGGPSAVSRVALLGEYGDFEIACRVSKHGGHRWEGPHRGGDLRPGRLTRGAARGRLVRRVATGYG